MPSMPLMKGDQLEARADQLRRQASDLVEGLLSLVIGAVVPGGPGGPGGLPRYPAAVADAAEPMKLVMAPSAPAPGFAPIINPPAAVKAGDVAKIPLTVTNEGATPLDVSFFSSDLVGDSGFGVPARKITVSPRVRSLQPGEVTTFEISVPIPQQTPPGTYTGIIQAAALEYLRAVLTVPVE